MSGINRSTYDAVLAIILCHDREHPVSRNELQDSLSQQGISLHVRDAQDIINRLISEGHPIISWTTGYWYFTGTQADIEAAERAANTLTAHADSEYAKADQMRKWCAEAKRAAQHETWRTAQQAGLFA